MSVNSQGGSSPKSSHTSTESLRFAIALRMGKKDTAEDEWNLLQI